MWSCGRRLAKQFPLSSELKNLSVRVRSLPSSCCSNCVASEWLDIFTDDFTVTYTFRQVGWEASGLGIDRMLRECNGNRR